MLLRREDPGFWEWFMGYYAYSFEEAAWSHAEFTKADGTFDTVTWEQWVESKREEYNARTNTTP
jgi:hypothetical protein